MNRFLGLTELQIIFFAAVFAGAIAIWAIFSQRRISARHATIELIRHSEADRDMIEARKVFNEKSRDDAGMGPCAADPLSDEFAAIKMVLNEFEMIAIGIQRGSLDDMTYRRWYRNGVVRSWAAAAPFVTARRNKTDNPALWHEFEEMARWYNNGKKPPRRWWWQRNIP